MIPIESEKNSCCRRHRTCAGLRSAIQGRSAAGSALPWTPFCGRHRSRRPYVPTTVAPRCQLAEADRVRRSSSGSTESEPCAGISFRWHPLRGGFQRRLFQRAHTRSSSVHLKNAHGTALTLPSRVPTDSLERRPPRSRRCGGWRTSAADSEISGGCTSPRASRRKSPSFFAGCALNLPGGSARLSVGVSFTPLDSAVSAWASAVSRVPVMGSHSLGCASPRALRPTGSLCWPHISAKGALASLWSCFRGFAVPADVPPGGCALTRTISPLRHACAALGSE